MRGRITLSGAKLAILLVAACSVLASVVYCINLAAVEALVTRQATAASVATAHRFETYLPDLENILTGSAPAQNSKDFISRALIDNGVQRFKLYDAKGAFVMDTAPPDASATEIDQPGVVNDDAAGVLATGMPTVELEVEHKGSGDELIAESYVPIVRNGKRIGVAEVYVNETATASMYRHAFYWSSGVIALVTALSFVANAVGMLLYTRERVVAADNIRFLANHDTLTSLSNRAHFLANLTARLTQAKRRSVGLTIRNRSTLSFIDLDYFKQINDRHGHNVGDKVLRVVSARLQEVLREGDLVSRFGGDEFIVAQFGFTTDDQVMAATKRLSGAFKDPLVIDNREFAMTASIGTSVSPQDGMTAEQLLQNADTAVYVAKARGRNNHCLFEQKFDEEKRKRLVLEGLVRDAAANNKFALHFQPLCVVDGSRLKGFEALLRMNDGAGLPVSAADFIPVAEQIGLIDEIGTWVLERACMTAATWGDRLQISVNLSVAQFRNHSVVRSTRSALAKSGLAPNRLLLEITESLLMTDTDCILEQLRDLKQLGVSIVMDDFGTGYSSLGYMLKFPFDRIKIDRSFVAELEQGNANATTLVQTIIALSHTLKMGVTAEGVETAAQVAALVSMNCDDAQGYFYGRPIPATAIPALLAASASRDSSTTSANSAWRQSSAA